MTLAALHLIHNSIDLSRLAERRGRDGGAPLGWRASRKAGFAGVQHGGTSEAQVPPASAGPETPGGTSPSNGICACGCGQPTSLAPQTRKKEGWVKGQPLRFAHRHNGCRRPVDYVVDPSGCWLWQGALDPNGYGRVEYHSNGTLERFHAHRWMYEQHVGPIPEGMHVHHVCRVPRCVNPDHLEVMLPGAHTRLHMLGVPKKKKGPGGAVTPPSHETQGETPSA